MYVLKKTVIKTKQNNFVNVEWSILNVFCQRH